MTTHEITYKSGATFTRACPQCGRFVTPPKRIVVNGFGEVRRANGRCKRHGRVPMNFIGYY